MDSHSSFFSKKFTIDGKISEIRKDFSVVKKDHLDKFANREEPQDVKREATDAVLDQEDILLSIDRLD